MHEGFPSKKKLSWRAKILFRRRNNFPQTTHVPVYYSFTLYHLIKHTHSTVSRHLRACVDQTFSTFSFFAHG
jgi:hypothetical protein